MITVQSSPNRIRTATAHKRDRPREAVPSVLGVTRHGYGRTPMGGYYQKPQITLKPCTANSLLRVLADKGQGVKPGLPHCDATVPSRSFDCYVK